MCKRLSERAADDLIAFVRKVMREGHADAQGLPSLNVETMGRHARDTLAKHGLLTYADDPEVAAVFMGEDAVPKCRFCGERHEGIWC